MKNRVLSRYALSCCVASAILSGCGGSQPPVGAPGKEIDGLSALARVSHHYESLYSFKGAPDGAQPTAQLVALKGVLYGSTSTGGFIPYSYSNGDGTIFTITRTGKERVLLTFGEPGTYGYTPSGLVALHGKFYGTAQGGDPSYGIVFKITTSGKESLVYNFKGKPDGEIPGGGLTAMDGKLYGETFRGGTGGRGKQSNHCRPGIYGCGTVFAIRASVNKERVLYSFRQSRDAWFPYGNLVALDGVFYGTTGYGGVRGACTPNGCGAIFSVRKSGREHMFYGFKGPPYDGNGGGSLVALNNVLYGISGGGGTSGLGTVFSVNLSGDETILHNFTGGADGANPSGLVAVNGFLYGTTQGGGENVNCSGCGTVFKMSTSGEEQVLYSFGGYPIDGSAPSANLSLSGGKLYGTTRTGGSANEGTVFQISP
ncbi:MAG: choice-of-anchor tandem repeat GloVer-containing protein [Candidatus Cybelea sp.]